MGSVHLNNRWWGCAYTTRCTPNQGRAPERRAVELSVVGPAKVSTRTPVLPSSGRRCTGGAGGQTHGFDASARAETLDFSSLLSAFLHMTPAVVIVSGSFRFLLRIAGHGESASVEKHVPHRGSSSAEPQTPGLRPLTCGFFLLGNVYRAPGGTLTRASSGHHGYLQPPRTYSTLSCRPNLPLRNYNESITL